jgi:2-oxoisovalerate dehydrogenase E2 component (dihydrolipoyl transacylase)
VTTRAVKLPDIGEGVAQAELVEWHVKVGDMVLEDAPLAAVMTDKATVEIPSLYSGKVVWLGGEVGDVLAIGSELVRIVVDGAATAAVDEPKEVVAASAVASVAEAAAPEPGTRLLKPPPAAPMPPLKVVSVGAPRAEGVEPLASPAVRARARENGIDLRQVRGSGPAGRITQADLDAVFAAPPGSRTAAAGRTPRTGSHDIKVVGLRRRIAERMALSYRRIPHITLVEEIDVTALEQLREKLNLERGERTKLTVLPFIMAGLVRALADHPAMNAHFDDEAGVITRFEGVHFGMATMTEAGLVVPCIRHAECLGLFETAAEIERLSHAARAGTADRQELTGSTFTISSLGPLGAVATTPIINHPEVAILGVNKMAVRPVWDGAQFQPRKMINVSASFDHRVIDGWDAAVFISRLKALIETPALMFVDA